jgi:tetratricopeptide (TPR) repeat protein
MKNKGFAGAAVAVVCLMPVSILCAHLCAQMVEKPGQQKSTMQEHYDAAETLQSQGDLAQADFQYKLFLGEVLQHVANGRAQNGAYARAVPLFGEAIRLTPNKTDLRMDYAQAALTARDVPKAQAVAQELVDAIPKGSKDAQAAKLHWLLGEALLGMDDNSGAKEQFEMAVAIDSTFENGYALAEAYLALLDKDHAAKIFAEMLKGFGDTAEIHMRFGLAYGNADFPEQAIPEFQKVLLKDPKMADAHYSLGASYLRRSGDTAFTQAEAEFRKELALHPGDALSYSELGYIAMSERKLPEAEHDLTRAAALDPQSEDTYLMLGDLYGQLNKPVEQEAALRKAIEDTTDPSRNHYQVRGAHYQLGLLLLRRGDTVEGKQEMQIAEDLLLENRKLDVANLKGTPIVRYSSLKTAGASANPAAMAELEQFEKQVGPAVADSFNNIGAIAAQNLDYARASEYFGAAAQWNPEMEGLDYNWGRAAFGAKEYRQAVICLSRYMQAHPEDGRPRVPLGMSQFELAEYKDAVRTLAPLGAQMDSVPLLDYAYAESQVETGDVVDGIARLQRLEQAQPGMAIVPLALGKAYAGQGQYEKAEPELRAAVRLRPADDSAKYQLALTLIALKQQDEARTLLEGMARSGANDPAVYYQLGKLQMEEGDAKAAVVNLEMAAKLLPGDGAIEKELVAARQRSEHP